MDRIKTIRIILVILSIMLLIGVAMTIWMLLTRDNREGIRVDLGEPIDPISFEHLCLIPGESCTYTLHLRGDGAKKYDVRLQFVETEEKTLKHFAYVRIESNGEVLCDELMEKVFEGDGIDLRLNLRQTKQQDLTITYYMPLEVGNEAQNAEAFFDLLITASNE